MTSNGSFRRDNRREGDGRATRTLRSAGIPVSMEWGSSPTGGDLRFASR